MKQCGEFAHVHLSIRIHLHDDVRALFQSQPVTGHHRATHPHVGLEADHPETRIIESPADAQGVIAAGIVYHDDAVHPRRQTADHPRDVASLIVRGNDNGEHQRPLMGGVCSQHGVSRFKQEGGMRRKQDETTTPRPDSPLPEEATST